MEAVKTTKGMLYGIGIGPGDPDLLTIKAVKALKEADIIYVPKSKEQESTALNIISEYLPSNAVIEHLEFSMTQNVNKRIASRKQNASRINHELCSGKTVIFLTLGDPMLYSTYNYILEHLSSKYTIETIPGIYSFAAISSILSMPLCKGDENLAVISSFSESAKRLIVSSDTIVFMKVSSYHRELYNFLKICPKYKFVMISNAGKSNQIIYNSIEDLKEKIPYFSTAILQKEKLSNIRDFEICQE